MQTFEMRLLDEATGEYHKFAFVQGPPGKDAYTAAQAHGYTGTEDEFYTLLGAAIPASEKGTAGGVASLGEDGKVPAGQLPAMNYDAAGSAAAVQGNLNTHTENTQNPHGVTAEQVGARPDTWTPTAADVGAIAENERGVAGGVASLGADGKVPEGQLPENPLSGTIIECGAITGKSGNSYSRSFSKSFSAPPSVFLQPIGSYALAQIVNVTSSGFSCKVYGADVRTIHDVKIGAYTGNFDVYCANNNTVSLKYIAIGN